MGNLKRPTLEFHERWEVVHVAMRRLILTGELAPGSRILETEFADVFGVSRGPVREAIRLLEVEGLAIRKNRLGSFVAPVDVADVDEIYSLRSVVEVLAVRRAMERWQPEFPATLARHLEEMRTLLMHGDHAGVAEPDIRFHGEFYIAADHRRLLGLWENLQQPLKRLISLSATRGAQDYDTTIQGHAEILAGVETRDTAATIRAVECHLDAGRSIILDFVRKAARVEG